MRVGIVSDIHCNVAGLKAALERMGSIDALLCPGDLIHAYSYSSEVVSVLRSHDARVVLGNHELGFLASGAAETEPDRQGVAFLQRRPLYEDFELGGKRFLMVHASPFDPEHQYLYGRELDLRSLARVEADYLVVGHTHAPADQRRGRTRLINAGSAGEPRPLRGELLLSCALLDTASDAVELLTYPAV